MTNVERQRSLNKKRKREGLGLMPYCKHCSHRRLIALTSQYTACWATQDSRDNNCLCAKAYNRMVRKTARK